MTPVWQHWRTSITDRKVETAMEKSKIENLNPLEYTHLPHADQHFEDHEQTDVPIRPLVATLIAIALVVVITGIGMWGLFKVFEAIANRMPENQEQSMVEPLERHVPDEYPELQGISLGTANSNSPAQDMELMRKRNAKILAGEAPLRDGEKGMKTGMPIGRAMEEALSRGIFKTAPATQPTQAVSQQKN
jgi:hypothetical protein